MSNLAARLVRRGSELGCYPKAPQIEQLERYLTLLARWNGRINLTALPLEGFPSRTLDRLIMEPLVAAGHVDTAPLTWVDFGSGGGSPAVPLKIVRPKARLLMVESRARKCAFLREVLRQLNLSTSAVALSRVEDVDVEPGSVDLISLRALKLDRAIAERASVLLKSGGRLLTLGPGLDPQPLLEGFKYLSSFPLPGGTSALHWYQLSRRGSDSP